MAPDDERFQKIAGQKFLLIDPAKPAVSGAWMDPRELEHSTPGVAVEVAPVVPPVNEVSAEAAPQAEPETEPEVPVASELNISPPDVAVLSDEVVRLKAKPATPELAFANTPVKQGQMLAGKPKPTSQDWAQTLAAEPAPDAEIVKTGAKVRLGS